MDTTADILSQIHTASAKRRLYLPHALRQMTRPDRMISSAEVLTVIEEGEIIEHYPDDPRGHSCLMLGFGENGRPIHVLCSPKVEFLAIITAYLPDKDEWEDDFRVRRRK
jgi:hypothetical protein